MQIPTFVEYIQSFDGWFFVCWMVYSKYGFMTYLRTLLGWSVGCNHAAPMYDGGESEQAV